MSLTLFLHSEYIHKDQDVLVFRHMKREHSNHRLTFLIHLTAQAASVMAISHIIKEIGPYQAYTVWVCMLSYHKNYMHCMYSCHVLKICCLREVKKSTSNFLFLQIYVYRRNRKWRNNTSLWYRNYFIGNYIPYPL